MTTACVHTPLAYPWWRNAAVVLSTLGLSAIAGIAVLALVYGLVPVVSALTHANPALLVLAAGVGIVMLVVRAQRAALLLGQQHPVRLRDTYSAMVVGSGLGDLVPLVPCGVGLRCFLTERLSGISIPYAAGVFLLEGTLDGLGLALLSGLLVLTLQLPPWLRLVLLAIVIQALVSLGVPVVIHLLCRSRRRLDPPEWIGRLVAWGGEIANGLESALLGGRARLLSVTSLSLLITALAGLQLVLVLSAFRLSTSPGTVLLILVLTLAAGNLPLNLPGSGTVSAAVALQVTGIHGAGGAGFVLVSRVMLSTEVTLMACSTLAWWTGTGKVRDLCVDQVFLSLYQTSWRAVARDGRTAGRWLASIVSRPIRGLAALKFRAPRVAFVASVSLPGTAALPARAFDPLSGRDRGCTTKSRLQEVSETTAQLESQAGTQDAPNSGPEFMQVPRS